MKKKVKVVIKKNLENVGGFGQIFEVAAGFARNYLIPQGYALYFSDPRSKEILKQHEKIVAEKDKEKEKIKDMASKISGKTLKIEAKTTEKGTLYEQIDKDDIAKLLFQKEKIKIAPEHIDFYPIKKPGETEITIRPGFDLEVKLKLEVEGIKSKRGNAKSKLGR